MKVGILLIAAGFGLCLSAGSAHLVYPDISMLPPVLGFWSGMLVAAGLVLIDANKNGG